jgi:glycosyltransferase involved in cell wall biosynthesis
MGVAPVRVAFVAVPRDVWAGGNNYQRNLFVALSRYCPGKITPVLFAAPDHDAADLTRFAAIPGVEVPPPEAAFGAGKAGLAAALLLGRDGAAAAAFGDQRIDVVLENARFFGWRLPYPAVAWFPDLQHLRLPHLFSRTERLRREIGFRVQIASGRTIMLSSYSADRDCDVFYPGARQRKSVVRFATEPPPDLLAADPRQIIAEHGLPQQYFYLPNQFWPHKNHALVLEALAILKQRGIDVVVTASGGAFREEDYLARCLGEVRRRGLTQNFRYLGLVPLAHVFALLRAATALINPSRFEGWSTTVEEAKSFGVPMILSDIDVHREQVKDGALYFGTDDAKKLADHIAAVIDGSPAFVVRELRPDVEARVATFANDFVKTVAVALRRT